LRGVAVGHGGTVLGVLRLQEREGRPLTPVEERLFAGLAAQAGLALHSAQVRAELEERHRQLTARTAELRAARDQLVAAQDAERRRLERDIHDGAQQQLVALRINLRLVQTVAARAPERAAQLIGEQEQAAVDAIATLRALSRGAEPEVLARDGLAEALRVASGTCPLPVSLDLHEVGRFARPVETAVYFCCLEALQNTVKHAGAGSVHSPCQWRWGASAGGRRRRARSGARLGARGPAWPTCASDWRRWAARCRSGQPPVQGPPSSRWCR
jgi:signal transduction histidine kinase